MNRSRIGERRGLLTIVAEREVPVTSYKRVQVDCICDCGGTKTIMYAGLRKGDCISCGCTTAKGEVPRAIAIKNNIGKRFGELTIIDFIYKKRRNGTNENWVICKCDCGAEKEIRRDSVKKGGTKSCGCFDIRRSSLGMHKERPYKIRYNMVRSCYSTKDHRYNRRGDKGIVVQDSRRYFTGWREDNKQYYSDERYFTRIDPFKDFTKENCKWDVCYNVSQFDLFSK